jgi:hypothetical protein
MKQDLTIGCNVALNPTLVDCADPNKVFGKVLGFHDTWFVIVHLTEPDSRGNLAIVVHQSCLFPLNDD